LLLGSSTPGSGDCHDIREILDRIGDKWSLQVIGVLGEGPRRFNELRRNIDGISQRVLTLTLRALERDGLLTRTVFPTIPPGVAYALSPLGHTLIEPVRALAEWARENRQQIRLAQAEFDKRLR
jgi:DNA-binding HxlR family transcriptional regulator